MKRLFLFASTLALTGAAGACRAASAPVFESSRPARVDASAPLEDEAVPLERRERRGDEIVVAGELVSTGSPVVLWFDEGGYNAYSTGVHFPGSNAADVSGLRFRPGRGAAPNAPQSVEREIDKLVLHYDVCGVSRECFRVLHDQRGLSVHFLLDIDGTLYQTLDVKETAWHARQANPTSIGVEIAQIGAYPPDSNDALGRWYTLDERGVRVDVPEHLGDGGVRTPGFVGRPARPGLLEGRIQGRHYRQYDFTPEQYESLARLTAALASSLPKLRLDAPRDERGRVLSHALTDAEFDAFAGVLGHYHVSVDKRDPGPAFDWEAYLARTRSLAIAP